MEEQIIGLRCVYLRQRIKVLGDHIQREFSLPQGYDLDWLPMVSRAWNLAVYALAKEKFNASKDKRCVINGV